MFACIYVYHMHAWGRQKMALGYQELELQITVGHHIGVENGAWVLPTVSPDLLSDLSNPTMLGL